MSLYNMLLGVNENAALLIKVLGFNQEQIPRLRDAWLDGEHIVIYTRTGGGNRDYYDAHNAENTETVE